MAWLKKPSDPNQTGWEWRRSDGNKEDVVRGRSTKKVCGKKTEKKRKGREKNQEIEITGPNEE